MREGKYDLEDIYACIEKIALKSGMIKINKNTYHCKGDENDLACLGIFIYQNLIDCAWFTKNVKSWDWLSEKEGILDLIAKNKARSEGVWQ